MTILSPIASFSGPHRFLSNFYPAETEYEGTRYRTSEHAYQASKFPAMGPHRAMIAALGTPGETKRAAKTFLHAQSKDFHDRKLDIMLACLVSKFTLNAELGKQLVATGERELIEGNTWGDVYWGTVNGAGENHLGKLLTRVRSGLFLLDMASIYPGDPTGDLSREAAVLFGQDPADRPAITVSRPCKLCPDASGRLKDGSRCQECGGTGWVAE